MLTPEEPPPMGYRELPSSLGIALSEMENSETGGRGARRARLRLLLRNKRKEWEDYRSNVTPFELKAYLSL